MGIFHSEDIRNEQGRIIYPELALLNEYLTTWRTHGLLILPLATGNDLHGLILINQDHPYRFTVDEIELARTITNQSAVAIQNANLFAETQWLFTETRQSSAELATLYDLGVKLTQVLEQKELIQIAFGYITHLLQVNSAALVLRQENGELIGLATEDDQFIGPITIPSTGISFSEYVLSTGEHLLIGDIERDRDRLPVPGYTVGAAARSWVGVPLIVRGTAIGVLSSQSDEPDHFGEPHIRLLHQIANQLAVAVDNARLFTTVQNYASELEQRVAERTAQLAKEHKRTQTLLGIISELSTSLDMDIVLNRTLSLINETTGAEHSLIMLIMPDQVNLFVRASLGYRGMVPKGGLPSALKADEGLAGWVISNRQPVLISDLMDDSRWVQAIDSVPQHRSAIAVPLEMGEETLGALLLFHQEVNQFSPDQLDLVEATAKQIAVAINNAQLYSLIRDQAERLGDMLRRQHVETSQSQAILEAVADGVLVTDANRIITLFNVSAERVLGLSREDIVGQSLENFTGLFGKAAFTWMDTIRAWSDDPSSIYQEGDGYAYSEHIQLEDKRVVAVHLAPVRLRNDFLGTVSIFRDITHQVLVDRLKSEFVATVSHELRTPMTSIKGYVEILLLGAAGKLNERQTHFLEIVRANTDRLAVLVNDLLDISRIEAGRVTLSLQPLDIRAIIDEALTEISRRSQEDQKPMNIRVNIPEGIPRVVGDMERVRQILDNLLENAYYYTPQDGKIVINGSQVGSEVQIDIVDTGIGILPSEQPRVFERFYRGEDPMVLATSGTGLGLSITQRLVEMHKGRIWLQSTGVPGEGSTFSFTLPVYIPEKIEAEADDVG
jgi:signal transduction histidine kinase